MAPMDDQPSLAPPGENADDRTQRQLLELLNELRLAMPGVQVLFAFLLAVPFQSRFGQVTEAQKALYVVALLAAAGASACFIASTAAHRLLFHRHQREYVIRAGNRLLIAGLGSLVVAMSAAAGLVVGFVYSPAAGWVALAATAGLLSAMWFVVPLSRRARLDRDARAPGGPR